MDIDFSAMMNASPNPYVVLDKDLRLVWMNRAYLAATMRERDELVGQKMFDAFPSEPDTESFRLLNDSLQRVLRTAEADEIALIRYDIPAADGSMETRFWSATHTPIPNGSGELAYILQHTVDVTELQGLKRLRDEADLIRRAEKVQSTNESLVRESHRLHAFFDQAPGFVAVLGGPDHVFQMANAAYHRLVGRDDLVGLKVADALPEVVDQGFVDILDQVYRSGEPYLGRREPVVLNVGANEDGFTRLLTFIFQPIQSSMGDVSGIIVQGYDVTDEVEFEERQVLLINELQHRVKNTISVVQVLAKQSFRLVPESEKALAVFSGRLSALSTAHGLLTSKNWGPTSMPALLRSTLSAAVGEAVARIELEGPEHLLEPETALGLTMIIHELATNALKHGSLSAESGQVLLSWRIDDRNDTDTVLLAWTETGGPVVSEPRHKGFGSRLIERGLGGGGSRPQISFKSEGFAYSISFAIAKNPQGAGLGRTFARFKNVGTASGKAFEQ
ncbi:PAS domain-containing protein [Qipengyuania sp. MTN3-11]|uniref:PAS domain-containing protein n=1 Tax=Qipengyuania sp. MTN3-11 TaxID=3056557 RepID=UPI0036F2679B